MVNAHFEIRGKAIAGVSQPQSRPMTICISRLNSVSVFGNLSNAGLAAAWHAVEPNFPNGLD